MQVVLWENMNDLHPDVERPSSLTGLWDIIHKMQEKEHAPSAILEISANTSEDLHTQYLVLTWVSREDLP